MKIARRPVLRHRLARARATSARRPSPARSGSAASTSSSRPAARCGQGVADRRRHLEADRRHAVRDPDEHARATCSRSAGTTDEDLRRARLHARAARSINHGVAEISGPGELAMGVATRLRNESDGTMRLVPGSSIGGLSCCVQPALLENHGDLSVTAPRDQRGADAHRDDRSCRPVQRRADHHQRPGRRSRWTTRRRSSRPARSIGGGGTLAVGDDADRVRHHPGAGELDDPAARQRGRHR